MWTPLNTCFFSVKDRFSIQQVMENNLFSTIFYASSDPAATLPSFSLDMNCYIIIGPFYSTNWPSVKVALAFGTTFPPAMKYKICKEKTHSSLLWQLGAYCLLYFLTKICILRHLTGKYFFLEFYRKSTHLLEFTWVFYSMTVSEQLSLWTWGYFSDQAMLQFYSVFSLG